MTTWSYLQAVCDLIDELSSCSSGRNNSVANSEMSQEVHSLLMLLSFALLQHTQQLRVLSDGMWCVNFRRSLLAIQPATDAAPNKAHDVLCQGACVSSPAIRKLLNAMQTCFISPTHETVANVDSITGQGYRHTHTRISLSMCNATQDPGAIVQQMPRQAEQSLTCNQLTKQAPQHMSVQQAT